MENQPDQPQEKSKSKILKTTTPPSSPNEGHPKAELPPQLSYDCLVIIFQYLPITDRVRCERVCKFWLEASRASWCGFKKLDLRAETWGNDKKWDNFIQHGEKVVERCGKFLTHVDLSDVPWGSRQLFRSLRIFGMCPNLRDLNLHGVTIGVPQLKYIVKNCGGIESLKLGRLTDKCNEEFLTEKVLGELKLKCLHLFKANKIFNGSCLRALRGDLLEEISLYSCCSFDLKFMICYFPNFKNLHTLKLRSMFLDKDRLFMRDARRRDTTLFFRNLKDLENLRVLDISQNDDYVNDSVIDELVPHRDRLISLDISLTSVTDVGLSVITWSTSLENLILGFSHRITGLGFGKMPNLRSLSCYSCRDIRENYLIKVLQDSVYLEEIDVTGCENLTRGFIEATKNAVESRNNKVGLRVFLGSGSIFRADDLPIVDSLKFEFADGYFCSDRDITYNEYIFDVIFYNVSSISSL